MTFWIPSKKNWIILLIIEVRSFTEHNQETISHYDSFYQTNSMLKIMFIYLQSYPRLHVQNLTPN